ncbi:hypothetical protein N9251_00655 [Gammaproteobacteria bacterium]|nr:hypothetical protein [Gammaproteobacteria bacterium]
MYTINWNIKIGKYKLKSVDSIEIERNVQKLADTAKIEIPNTVLNSSLELEKQIKVGDPISIQLGYNGHYRTEFEGFIQSINTDASVLKLECDDLLYLYKVPVIDRNYPNISVRELLTICNIAVMEHHHKHIEVNCTYDFTYKSYTTEGNTALDILTKIQSEAKPNIYVKGNVLHVHPKEDEVFGHVTYNFEHNIESSGTDLKYKRKEDKKLQVKVKSTKTDGSTVEKVVGEKGGEIISKDIQGVEDELGLQLIANHIYDEHCYDGYEGSFNSWLEPYCDAGYVAKIIDPEQEYKAGSYYVISVVTKVSKSGGQRKIKIGKLVDGK